MLKDGLFVVVGNIKIPGGFAWLSFEFPEELDQRKAKHSCSTAYGVIMEGSNLRILK